jgi:8-oxo-dGTP diphosphatase
MIIRTRFGSELLEFIPGEQPICPEPTIPLTFTQVVVMRDGGVLLVYNPERTQWELPGGGINAGEHVDACAARELLEESCQVAERLTYRGLFKMRMREKTLEYGALYTAEIGEVLPFTANEEADKITFWNAVDALDGAHISEMVQALMRFC